MAVTLRSLSDLAAMGFDDIIDVRAPAEYAEDHVPGAISLPVLDDTERARIGTIYYFAHFFVVMPVIGFIERPLALPKSISTPVLAGGKA